MGKRHRAPAAGASKRARVAPSASPASSDDDASDPSSPGAGPSSSGGARAESPPPASQDPQQPTQYQRIERQAGGAWAVLVPAPAPGAGAAPGPLIHLGAIFPTANDAARAADRALVAIQGRQNATSQLNFPEAEYGAEQQRRYGPALSAFLAELCREAVHATKEARRAARREQEGDPLKSSCASLDRSEDLAMRRLKRDSLYVSSQKRCGVCPACRLPWDSSGCHRVLEIRRQGYKASEAARLKAYGVEGAAAKDLLRTLRRSDKAKAERLREIMRVGQEAQAAAQGSSSTSTESSSTSDSSESESDSDGEGDSEGEAKPAPRQARRRRRAAASTAEHAAAQDRGDAEQGEEAVRVEQYTWLEKPPKAWSARLKFNNEYEQLQRQAAAAAAAEQDAAAAAAAAPAAPQRGQELLLPGGLCAAPLPKDYFDALPHRALLGQVEDAAAAGATLALVSEEDPRWVAPPSAAGQGQCALCRGWHAAAAGHLCPVLQVTNMAPVPEEECKACAGQDAPGCKKCARGTLAPALWQPPRERQPWAENAVRPATLGLMHAVQSVGSAAIVDLARPELTGRLGPKALLAIGLLAEHVAAAEVRSRLAGRDQQPGGGTRARTNTG